MAEALLRDRLAQRGVDGRVHSAGLRFRDEPASAEGVEVLAERGIDLSAHRSRIMDAGLVNGADLVIAMAKEHVIEAVLVAPDAWPRVFTLKELLRRAEAIAPRLPGEPLDDWVSRVNAGRERGDVLGLSGDDDVADPIGLDRKAYERTAAELTDLIDRLVDLAWPPAALQAG